MVAKLQYSPSLIAKAVALAKKTSVQGAAKKLGIPRTSLSRWIHDGVGSERLTRDDILQDLVEQIKVYGPTLTSAQFRERSKFHGGWMSHWPSWTDFLAAGIRDLGLSEADVARHRRLKQRARDQVDQLQRQLKLAEREINAAEDLRSAVFGLAAQSIDPPAWTLALPKKGDSVPGIPLLLASDFQWGEVIKANELDGINAFNARIASDRYKRLIERTVDLCCGHMVNPKYPGIIYARGGDMISGDIHQELRETNDLQSIPAAIDLIEHEAAGIRVLVEKFGKVWVISVPGNHGRTTIKPHAKKYVETNYDYLIACMLEREFRNDPRVEFCTPMSGDARFKVYSWQFLLTHGDRIGSSGGQGFIGPAATITRGMKKLVDYYATLGHHIDWCLVGHFHTPMELEYGWSNGSLPGYSEYAKTFRMRPHPPSQWLLFVHPKYGVTCRWPILVEPRPRLGAVTQPVAMAA